MDALEGQRTIRLLLYVRKSYISHWHADKLIAKRLKSAVLGFFGEGPFLKR